MSRFHADLRIPSTTAADPASGAGGTLTGGILLFNPNTKTAVVRKLMITTDTPMRIVVGVSDQDGQRCRAGSFAANGGAAPDVCFELEPGAKLMVFHSAAGNVDVAVDGDLLGP